MNVIINGDNKGKIVENETNVMYVNTHTGSSNGDNSAVDVDFDEYAPEELLRLEEAPNVAKRTGIYALKFDESIGISKIDQSNCKYWNDTLFNKQYDETVFACQDKQGVWEGHLALNKDVVIDLGAENFCLFVNHLAKAGFFEDSKQAIQSFVYLLTGLDKIDFASNKCIIIKRESTKAVNNIAALVRYLVQNGGDDISQTQKSLNPAGDKFQTSQKLFVFQDPNDNELWEKRCNSPRNHVQKASGSANSAEKLLLNLLYLYFVDPLDK